MALIIAVVSSRTRDILQSQRTVVECHPNPNQFGIMQKQECSLLAQRGEVVQDCEDLSVHHSVHLEM